MFNAVSMILIADRDHFSNSTLSLGLRKLGLARNVICTTSTEHALAYLHKQRTNSYPFPEIILLNPNNEDMTASEFLEHYRTNFADDFDSRIVILIDKEGCSESRIPRNEPLIAGRLFKPVSTGQLIRIFNTEVIRQPIG
jgi:CheY-like chemotaxis protein